MIVGVVLFFGYELLFFKQNSELQDGSEIDVVPSTMLVADVYPLYADLTWESTQKAEQGGMSGYAVTSNPVLDVTNIAAITMPFEAYYADMLTNNGWEEDITMAAGGPGGSVTTYKKDAEYVVLQYNSSFSVNSENEPAQCPCEVTFSIFSSSRQ